MGQSMCGDEDAPLKSPWLTKKHDGEVRLRLGSTHPTKAHSLSPMSAVEEPDSSLLSHSPMVGKCLVQGTVVAFTMLSFTLMAALPCTMLGAIEMQASFVAVTMQVASLLQDLTSKQRLCAQQQWLQRAVLTVKALAMLTNATLCVFDTPFVTDPVTGRPNCMLRWAEWTVLAFTLTFIVESVDSRDLRGPLLSAGSQGLSTLCGLLLPLCPSVYVWVPLAALSFALWFFIFYRLWQRAAAVRHLKETLPAGSYELRSASLGLALLKQARRTPVARRRVPRLHPNPSLLWRSSAAPPHPSPPPCSARPRHSASAHGPRWSRSGPST